MLYCHVQVCGFNKGVLARDGLQTVPLVSRHSGMFKASKYLSAKAQAGVELFVRLVMPNGKLMN